MKVYNKVLNSGVKLVIFKTKKFKAVELKLFLKDKIEYTSSTKKNLLLSLLCAANKEYKSEKKFSSFLKDSYNINVKSFHKILGETSLMGVYIKGINSKFIENKINIEERMFKILNMILYKPLIANNKFNNSFFNKRKSLYKSKLLSNLENKREIAKDKVNSLLGKDNPFGYSSNGDLKELRKIKNEDLVIEYKKLFNKEACLLVIGNVDIDKIEEYALKYLNNFSSNVDTNVFYKKEIKKIKDKEEKSSFAQSTILAVYKLPVYKNSRLYGALLVYLDMLNYYLFKIIREERNYCYNIYAASDPYNGVMRIISDMAHTNYKEAKIIVDKIVNTLKRKVDEERLKVSKDKIIDNYSQINDVASKYMDEYYNYLLMNKKFNVNKVINTIKRVRGEDVIKVAKKVKRIFSFVLKEKQDD